jgi:MFS family permease
VAPWRWVFYINLPIGIPALFITQIVLKLPFHRQPQRIDWTGFTLMAIGVASLILGLTWGGTQAAWTSREHPPVYNLRWFPGVGAQSNAPGTSLSGADAFLSDWLVTLLLIAGTLFVAAFIVAELKVKQPLLPMRLFNSRNFSLASAVSFIVGAGMFGGFVFLPTYLQVSTGVSATVSGFLLLPMMAGMFPFMTASGIVISRTGRYKVWPLVGLPTGAVGMLVLSLLTATSPWYILWGGMFLMGAGIGMTMQVMVMIVQNTLEMRDMGIGTSSNTFLRQMGGVFGIGIFGALFAAKLRTVMGDVARAAVANHIDISGLGDSLQASPGQIHTLPAAVRDPITAGVASAIAHIFLYAAPVMLLGWLMAMLVKEVPLRSARSIGGAAPTPGSGTQVGRNLEKTADATAGAPVVLAPRNGHANGHANGHGGGNGIGNGANGHGTPFGRGPGSSRAIVAFTGREERQWFMGYEINDLQARVDQAVALRRR